MKQGIAMALLLAFAAAPASAARARGGGGHPSGGHFARGFSGGGHGMPGGAGGGGGYARARGVPPSGAQLRHPRAGTGSYYYGHGYGHGHYGHYPYSGHYHGYYPYYGGYGYYPYAYGYPAFSLGLGFYYGGGSPTPVYGADPSAAPYGEGEEPYEGGAPDDSAELRMVVQPDDASIYVDNEFRGIARRTASLRVTPGRHRIEAVRPGFRVAEQRVEVAPGDVITVHIELERP